MYKNHVNICCYGRWTLSTGDSLTQALLSTAKVPIVVYHNILGTSIFRGRGCNTRGWDAKRSTCSVPITGPKP